MFKSIRIILAALLLVILIGQMEAVAAVPGNVKDYLNYLKDNEVSELQSEIDKVKGDFSLDVVIVITNKTDGKSSMEYADDYYDKNGYGVGGDHSGLLMLINMEKREVWISTTGKAIDIFTDSRISDMVSHVKTLLSNGKYYDASKIFISDVRNYASMGVPNGQHRVDTGANPGTYPEINTGVNSQMTYMDRVIRLTKSFMVFIIALAVSIIATVLVSISGKGKVTINNQTYEGKGSFVLSDVRDDFIRESTTRTKIQKSSNSSDTNSSTHSSSSGTSHGGGGGGF